MVTYNRLRKLARQITTSSLTASPPEAAQVSPGRLVTVGDRIEPGGAPHGGLPGRPTRPKLSGRSRRRPGPGTIGRVTTVTHVFTTPHQGSDSTERTGHEQVVFCQRRSAAGCAPSSRSTPPPSARRSAAPASTPTPARTTRWPTCCNLSRGMAYKNALAGLDLGGGKAVIIGDPADDKSEALLRAYGRFVAVPRRPLLHRLRRRHLLRGHGRRRPRVPTSSPAAPSSHGGAGDSSVLTALRRLPGHARRRRGTPGARPRWPAARVGVAGVGKVGRHLVEHLSRTAPRSSSPTSSAGRGRPASGPAPRGRGRRGRRRAGRPRPRRLRAVRARRRARRRRWSPRCRPRSSAAAPTTSSPTRAWRSSSPTAGSSTPPTTWSTPAASSRSPTSCDGFDFERARAAGGADLRDHHARSSPIADADGVPPAVAADRLAEQRMADVGRLRGIWLGSRG